MRSVLRALGRFGVVTAFLVPATCWAAPALARDGCLDMLDGEVICDATPEDENYFRVNTEREGTRVATKAAPTSAACQADKATYLFRPPPATASFDDRLCALMLSTGALPFGASHEAWLNPGLAFSSRRLAVWASIRVDPDNPWYYTSRVSSNRANRFWPFHLKRFGGPPLRYTLVEYRPSRPNPVEQFSTAEQMTICAEDFRQQVRKAETFLGVRLDRIEETLLERGIYTVADGAHRPGYYIEGRYIRLEIWFGLMSTAKPGSSVNGLCRPFLFFQELKSS